MKGDLGAVRCVGNLCCEKQARAIVARRPHSTRPRCGSVAEIDENHPRPGNVSRCLKGNISGIAVRRDVEHVNSPMNSSSLLQTSFSFSHPIDAPEAEML
jgi:hypothetical protein